MAETTEAPALWLSEADVAALLTLEEAINVLERAYAAIATAGAAPLRRAHARDGDAILHTVGGIIPGAGMAGVKSWLYTPGGASPLLLLWDLDDGSVLGVVEAFRMGQWRTAATSGLATRLLARTDADVLALLGTGKQAAAQAEAVAAVRGLRRIQVYGRDPERRAALCRRLQDGLGIEVTGTDVLRDALAGAAVTTAVTRAADPFLGGELLAPGMHVNAVGAIVPTRRELHADAVARADVVVADSPEQAAEDAGELIAAVEAGVLDRSRIRSLGEVVVDPSRGRDGDDAITLFKAVGVGMSDVALGVELVARARRAGLGAPLPATREPHLSQSRPPARSRAHV